MAKKGEVRLSHLTFTLLLEEMLSGPCTAKALSEHTGMGHRVMCRLVRTMHAKKVVHVAGWEKDAIGRVAVKVWQLGHGRGAKKPNKPRAEVNRDYRARASRAESMAALVGTPFAGLGSLSANESNTRKTA